MPDALYYDVPAGALMVFGVMPKDVPAGFTPLDLTTVTGATFSVALQGQAPALPTWTGYVLQTPAPTSSLIYIAYTFVGGEFGQRIGRYFVSPTLTVPGLPPIDVESDWIDVLPPGWPTNP